MAGKTIMPGFVDAHSHMWAPRGLHQTEVWQYLANLAYGVTTTRDPQTSTPDVFAYAEDSDSLLGVAPWLLPLYFTFGVVAAVVGEMLARNAALPTHVSEIWRISAEQGSGDVE